MYLTSEEFKQSLEGLSGEFEGIGATIGTVDARRGDELVHRPRRRTAGW